MKKSHEYFFNEAGQCSGKSGHPVHRHGCVAVRKNTIVGKGTNKGYVHAEVCSLIRSQNSQNDKSLRNSPVIIFVVRVSSTGEFRNSKPCENCQRFMRKANVSKVYYSTDSGFEMMKFM